MDRQEGLTSLKEGINHNPVIYLRAGGGEGKGKGGGEEERTEHLPQS